MLQDFTSLIPELYDSKDCTLNVHILTHLCDDARHWGPIWGFSAFSFENKNGLLMGHVHSPHRIAHQLLFSIHLNQKLDSLEDELLNTQPEHALSFLGLNKKSTHNGYFLLSGSYVVGNASMSTITRDEQAPIQNLIGDSPTEALHFTRVYHQDTIFTSRKNDKSDGKRNSSICSYAMNETGVIERY